MLIKICLTVGSFEVAEKNIKRAIYMCFGECSALGVDTLRCLALATVDEPLSPSKMELEKAENFADYEVCKCTVLPFLILQYTVDMRSV